jgi:hypothetical protein
VGELEFEQSQYEFDLPELGHLTLQCPKKKEVDLDVIVRAFEKELHLPEFARALPASKATRSSYPWAAYIDYALGSPRCPVAVLAGERSVAIANFRDHSFDGFQLFRQSDEDQGFWNLEMFFTREGLVVLHESGVALINNAGKLAWHEKIIWNDKMFARDDEKLLFGGDIGEGTYEWSIRLRDGVTKGKPPL